MKKDERQKKILDLLRESKDPISGSQLAAKLQVSRQIIVSDLKELKAKTDIVATSRGYEALNKKVEGILEVCHGVDQLEEELNILTDYGCTIQDVRIEHPLYGQLIGMLEISSRADVRNFMQRLNEANSTPLTDLTQGHHAHLVYADNAAKLAEACEALKEAGILTAIHKGSPIHIKPQD